MIKKAIWIFRHLSFQHCISSQHHASHDALIRSAGMMPHSFQNGVHCFNDIISIAVGIVCFLCVLSVSTPMQLNADHVPPSGRIAYVCMTKLFTNLYAYDQRRTHARNVNSSCSSLMMRREIVAAKSAGITTSVIMEIAPRGNRAQRCASHDCSCTITMEYEMESEFSSDKKIRAQWQTLECLRSN